jgi:uncharacterized repeat protein (TIGR03803 family)
MSDGANPYGGVIFDQAGNLYGTTSVLGANGSGTVFELSPSGGTWTLNVLYNFTGSFGAYGGLTGNEWLPIAGVIFDAAGNLYGTTIEGGANGRYGNLFKLSPTRGGGWTYIAPYNFSSNDEAPFAPLILDTVGNLYSTTGGTVIELSLAGGG